MRLCFAVAGLVILGSCISAHADDTDRDVHEWFGAYAGVSAGLSGGVFNQKWDDFGVQYANDHAKASGIIGGGQVGFAVRVPSSKLVVGLEADLQGSGLEGTYADYGADVLKFGTRVDWFGSVRLRAGYDMGHWQPYATAGFAYGHVTNSYSCPTNCVPAIGESWSSMRTGWTAGAGLEMALSRTVSFKAEYLYTNLGSWRSEDPQDAAAMPGEIHNVVATTFNTVRIGFNMKLQ